jgi:hypothetical protein
MCLCFLIYPSVIVLQHFDKKPESDCFTSVFFDFSKNGIFKGYFDLFFDREEQFQNNFLHYKPCPLTSLSSRKSWEIFAKNF